MPGEPATYRISSLQRYKSKLTGLFDFFSNHCSLIFVLSQNPYFMSLKQYLSLFLLIALIHPVQARMILKIQSGGRMYGRVLDDKTGKGIEAASVQIWQDGYDEQTHEAKPLLKGGMLTETNGDFSIEGLPTSGYMKLKVIALGYETLERRIQFDVVFDKKKGFDIDAGTFDKDLGDIKIKKSDVELNEVVVKADEPFMKTAVDRKIYNTDKMAVASGGTATDAMKTIPGVNVDLDGKVTVRNAQPIIYVDGRPTNLTLDQIPSNSIQQIEVITNPSAKYDASGKGGGIINIVLKKDKRMGYNANVVAALDRRLMTTLVAGFNIREKKINFFGGANNVRNKSIADGTTDRLYNINNSFFPVSRIYQSSENIFRNRFANAYLGFDWLINNRNTITLSQSYSNGFFKTADALNINNDSTLFPKNISLSQRNSNGFRDFSNLGTSLQYKKLYTKNGKEFTADFYFNKASSNLSSNSTTDYFREDKTVFRSPAKIRQEGGGGFSFYIGQLDYTEPVGKKGKIETGIRSQVSNFDSRNTSFVFNNSGQTWDSVKSLANIYSYQEQIHAAYLTYTKELKKLSYELGLRAENYYYQGKLAGNPVPFENNYPVIDFKNSFKPWGLFPSIFVTYKFDEEQDLQLNASRRVNRPNFFQLIPYIDFSDSLNLSKGNPGLRPEYSYQAELSYNYVWGRKKSFMANAYFRNANNLITNIRKTIYNDELGRNIVISTFDNANTAMASGLEINLQNTVGKKIEMNTNVNIYYSQISGNSATQTASRSQTSMFARYYVIYRVTKSLIFQLMADYQSKVSVQPEGGGGMQFFMNAGTGSSAQGFQRQTGGIDLAVKYEFSLKKDKSTDKKKKDDLTKPGALILNFTDILHTRRTDVYSASDFFIQNYFYQRDWRMLRLTFTYRFGKFDNALFRRKNQNRNSGPQIM